MMNFLAVVQRINLDLMEMKQRQLRARGEESMRLSWPCWEDLFEKKPKSRYSGVATVRMNEFD
jgi:hypothetical protein